MGILLRLISLIMKFLDYLMEDHATPHHQAGENDEIRPNHQNILKPRSKPKKPLQHVLADAHSRYCIVDIWNNTCFKLINPITVLVTGQCLDCPPLKILPNEAGVCAFSKGFGLFGAFGLISYEIEYSSRRLAIMYSVPWNRMFYDNWYAIALIDDTIIIDKNLVKQMYEAADYADDQEKKRACGKAPRQLLVQILKTPVGTFEALAIMNNAPHAEVEVSLLR